MNIEAQELADQIRATARIMRECHDKMIKYSCEKWKSNEYVRSQSIFTHAHEMRCAANTADTWADGIQS
jgi:hypothetical protein